MRIVMLSKALVVGAYQRKAELIAALGVELTVFTPPSWGDKRGQQMLERRFTHGYELCSLPVRFKHNFHLHHYPTLHRELETIRPDLLHMDEEPYNLATWLALRAAKHLKIPALFFTWQNLDRRYPLPFSWFEQQNYRNAALAIAGNRDAVAVLRGKGYPGQVEIIPQFGVDHTVFNPQSAIRNPQFIIGYAGGLLAEKGVDLLLRACATLHGNWRLEIGGEGDQRCALEQLVDELRIADRVRFVGRVNSAEMPTFYRQLDVLVVPSRTLSNWKEQFGRVLIEAMACEVAVIGSNSGEIPNVIGAAGLIFQEGDADALCVHLQRLLDQPSERQRLGQLGRQRVLGHFTMAQIAEQTVELYRKVIERALGGRR